MDKTIGNLPNFVKTSIAGFMTTFIVIIKYIIQAAARLNGLAAAFFLCPVAGSEIVSGFPEQFGSFIKVAPDVVAVVGIGIDADGNVSLVCGLEDIQ